MHADALYGSFDDLKNTYQMTSPHQSKRDIAIRVGRAYLQMVTAAHVLLEREPVWTETLLLKLVKRLRAL